MNYEDVNSAKANFHDIYRADTPHAYLTKMASLGFVIGEEARPYCAAAASLIRQQNGGHWPVQMLDVGCSYGVGSALIKYGCSFAEMCAFFSGRAPQDYTAACAATRLWLNVTAPVCDVRCVGLDNSPEAIRFALDAGLLAGGIAADFEKPGNAPTAEQIGWLRSCNLMMSTGAIGYVTSRTLNVVLKHLGKDHPGSAGPLVVSTILRMFDLKDIRACFESHGYVFEAVPGARLLQRRFADAREKSDMLTMLHDRGIVTRDWEDQGKMYADLYIGAPRDQFAALSQRMRGVEQQLDSDLLEEPATAH
ncbi:MAG: hypothetical protein ACREJ2_01340 [Planctomycetota bacterium]